MKYLIEDFIEQTNASTSREEIFALYQKAIGQHGYNSAFYTLVTDHPSLGERAGHGAKCNYPDEWMNHYWEKGYSKIDPVTKFAFRTNAPFTWRMLTKDRYLTTQQTVILEEAGEAGLHSGVGIPIYGAHGEIAGVGLASDSKKLDPDRNILSRLKLFSEQFHLAYNLCGQNPRNIAVPSLTKEETEILKWCALGKSISTIAVILNCSDANIKYHMQKVFKKLEVNEKILAVNKAIWLGLIPLDEIRI